MQRIRMTKVPFNYRHSPAHVSVIRDIGVFPVGTGRGMIDPAIAAAALALGYAEEFDQPRKTRAATSTRRPPATSLVEYAADEREPARMDRTDLVAYDSADSSSPVADAG